ncbi:MAG: SIMPL domain-containing protein [Bacteroidetes bacterium]|nr:SIMPL domain-containing protein [Bacteroidota bacterium]MBU1677326.1 SIMPL domain-containing protein [Bacteroidota bacterium]MBU2505598.1 SIMPL domain-containing protein [Bacteroidota bacterium]
MSHAKKLILSITLLFLSFCGNVAQEGNYVFLTIQAVTDISIPADQVIFRIDLSSENESAEIAFKIHKEKEIALIQLLKQLEIQDSNIAYSLLNINRLTNSRTDVKNYRTSQTIRIKIADFSKYETLQILLLQSGISSFKSVFSTSNIEEAQERGIKQIVASAKKEAEIYAKSLNLTLAIVTEIETRLGRHERGGEPLFFTASSEDNSTLLDIPQAYKSSITAQITFRLE